MTFTIGLGELKAEIQLSLFDYRFVSNLTRFSSSYWQELSQNKMKLGNQINFVQNV